MIRIMLLALGLSIVVSACNSNATTKNQANEKSKVQGAFGYDLSKPVQSWDLPDVLKEVSGNAWIDADHLVLIEDIHPVLYLMRLGKEQAVIEKEIAFKKSENKKFDIEDVAIVGNTAYAIWSHGTIYKIDNWRAQPIVSDWSTGLDKANNTEGLCFDPVSGNLLVACKNESGIEDEKKSSRSVYKFDLKTGRLASEPFLVIEKKDLEKLIGEKVDFFPSAIAVHPKTNDIYILSTRGNKIMVQYSHDGKIKGYQMINKDLLPQPEGLCFAPDGTLYVTSEGRHGNPARIYKFNSVK